MANSNFRQTRSILRDVNRKLLHTQIRMVRAWCPVLGDFYEVDCDGIVTGTHVDLIGLARELGVMVVQPMMARVLAS